MILMTDYSEMYAWRLLQGILNYSKNHNPWGIFRLHRSFKDKFGTESVISLAKKWQVNTIIGQFDEQDDLDVFRKNGILVIAQDYKERFSSVPNITGDYLKTGMMAASFFIRKGFKNFAFYGYKDAVWSYERGEGFKDYVQGKNEGYNFYEYLEPQLNNSKLFEMDSLLDWIKDLPKGTAVFCSDDNQSNKILEVCRTYNISVPDDIAILGVDNDDIMCNLSAPSLSSIALDVVKAGYNTALAIDEYFSHGKPMDGDIIVSPMMVVERQSTETYSTEDPMVLKAVRYIHDNYCKKIVVQDIVAQVPLSRRLLEMRFKKITKLSIYQYILELRFKKFVGLLLNTDGNINELVNETGFNDYDSLINKFKKTYGCSPSEYRKRHQRL